MAFPRIRFRPPGVKPWTRFGTLGPFRARLGMPWVLAPLVVGVALVVAWAFLARGSSSGPPGPPFVSVGSIDSFHEGVARPVDLGGVFVGMTEGRVFAVRQEQGCSVEFCAGRFYDCRGATYALDGRATTGPGTLDRLPVRVHEGTVYVDPAHPVPGSPASPVPAPPERPC